MKFILTLLLFMPVSSTHAQGSKNSYIFDTTDTVLEWQLPWNRQDNIIDHFASGEAVFLTSGLGVAIVGMFPSDIADQTIQDEALFRLLGYVPESEVLEEGTAKGYRYSLEEYLFSGREIATIRFFQNEYQDEFSLTVVLWGASDRLTELIDSANEVLVLDEETLAVKPPEDLETLLRTHTSSEASSDSAGSNEENPTAETVSGLENTWESPNFGVEVSYTDSFELEETDTRNGSDPQDAVSLDSQIVQLDITISYRVRAWDALDYVEIFQNNEDVRELINQGGIEFAAVSGNEEAAGVVVVVDGYLIGIYEFRIVEHLDLVIITATVFDSANSDGIANLVNSSVDIDGLPPINAFSQREIDDAMP